MERSEPALVPEWLRSTGSVSGAGNSAHHSVSHCSQSGHSPRNRCSRSANDKDTPHSSFVDRSSSSASRRISSSSGSSKHPYSSFSRNSRDKNRDKEKERSVIWDHDGSDPFSDILISRVEKDALRRSKSLVYGKPGEVLPRKAADSKNGGSNNLNGSNGVLCGAFVSSGTQKSAFEKDFPSLGPEEKQGVPDIGRVSSPNLSLAVQCLPIGNPGLIGGEVWTSALAEVPSTITSNGTGSASVPQNILAAPSSGPSGTTAGLNMAEALSQAPSRARTTPQPSDKILRLEELAIKQSRQLIPMTPSMPKGLVLSSDKSRPKLAPRTSEMTVPTKSVQPQALSSQIVNPSSRVKQVRSDTPRQSPVGKFHVLKSVWENGASPMPKDISSPTNNASGVVNSQLAAAQVAPPPRSPNSSKLPMVENKVAALALNFGSNVEKRSSQAQSRSDFFNLMRRKTSTNASDALTDSRIPSSPSTVEKSSEALKEDSAPLNPCAAENGGGMVGNGITHAGEKDLCLNGAVYPDEEEAAFLRSLGWEENAGEDDGLTEEEINAFYEEYMKVRPSLKLCRGMQPKLSVLSESHTTGSSRASSKASSSESEIEA